MPRSDEITLIERFFRPLAGEGAFDLADDAGLMTPEDGFDQVITSDTIASNVHFLADDPPEAIARKALRVNLSDIASKGASPVAYILNLAMGPEVDDPWLAGFMTIGSPILPRILLGLSISSFEAIYHSGTFRLALR